MNTYFAIHKIKRLFPGGVLGVPLGKCPKSTPTHGSLKTVILGWFIGQYIFRGLECVNSLRFTKGWLGSQFLHFGKSVLRISKLMGTSRISLVRKFALILRIYVHYSYLSILPHNFPDILHDLPCYWDLSQDCQL